jgi:hypothetical protein
VKCSSNKKSYNTWCTPVFADEGHLGKFCFEEVEGRRGGKGPLGGSSSSGFSEEICGEVADSEKEAKAKEGSGEVIRRKADGRLYIWAAVGGDGAGFAPGGCLAEGGASGG